MEQTCDTPQSHLTWAQTNLGKAIEILVRNGFVWVVLFCFLLELGDAYKLPDIKTFQISFCLIAQ